MTAAELQVLDEQLTAAGHDSECSAYEPGKECSCGRFPGVPPQCAGIAASLQTSFGPLPTSGVIQLVGPVAAAYLRYKASSKALLVAQAAYKAAGDEFSAAHQAFADASARADG